MSGSTFTVRLLGATATLLLAAACGSTTTSPVSNKPATPGAGTSGVVGVATTSLGPVLVDSKGFTVYMLTADTKGHSTCSAQCLQYWPLVPAPAGAGIPPVQGVSAALATTKATSGASMVTAGTRPLVRWPARESRPSAGPGMPCRHRARPSRRRPSPLRRAPAVAAGAATATELEARLWRARR